MPRCQFSHDAAVSATAVENLFLEEYMPGAPGEYVKVYLYGLMLCHAEKEGDIARALSLEEQEVREAFLYWQCEGLVQILSYEPFLVEYRSVKKRAPSADCGMLYRHRALFEGLHRAFPGRELTAQELRVACDWVEVFGLKEETAVFLAEYCAKKKGTDIGIKYMDAVAKGWADAGVSTLTDAHAHLAEYEEKTGGAAKIKQLWRQGNNPTGPELELYEKWTRGWGFTAEAVYLLAHETTGADKPSFRYLDAIISTYRDRGLITQEAIAEHIAAHAQRAEQVRERTRLIFERAGLRRTPTLADREQVELWLFDWKLPLELVFFAAEKAASANRPFLYLRKLVADYRQKGIMTLAAAKQEAEKHETKAAERKTSADNWTYSQHDYSEEDFRSILVPLGGEERNG